MKRFTLALVLVLFTFSMQAQNWQFNTDGDTEGWAGVAAATQVTIEEGLLKAVHNVDLDNEGPKIIQTGLGLAAADYTTAEIRLKTVDWLGEGKQFRFFWGREDSPDLDGNKLITVGGITPDADNFQVIEVDLNHDQWTGTITQIRLDLCMWNGKEVHVDYIELKGAQSQHTLTLNITGNGSVEVDGAPYSDPVVVDEGTTLNLKAIADLGYVFDGWSGDLTSVNAEETITMDSDKTVTATFSEEQTGVVSRWDFNTDGDAEGWAGVAAATQVTVEGGLLKTVHNVDLDNEGPKIIQTGLGLAAGDYTTAEIRLKTVDWLGEGKQFRFFWGREDSPDLDGNKLITVGGITPDADNFQVIEVDLNHDQWTGTITQIRLDLCMWNGKEVHVDYIELKGAQSQHTLTLNITGNGSVEVDGTPYTEPVVVDEGTTLDLKAIADLGYVFDGWTGDLTSVNTDETITMDSDKTVTATFSEEQTGGVAEWEFNTDGDAEGWAGVAAATQVTIEEGLLKAVHNVDLDNEGPKIIQTGLGLAAADYTTAEIRLKSVDWLGEGKQLRFFWGREDSPDLGGDKLITVGGITPDADNYQIIQVDLSHDQWTGTITQIRFDLLMWNGKEVHVDYIRLLNTTNVISDEIRSFSIYPNPAREYINIEGNWKKEVDYRIFNITGEIISTGVISSDNQKINLMEVPSGMYFISIDNQIAKFVVR